MVQIAAALMGSPERSKRRGAMRPFLDRNLEQTKQRLPAIRPPTVSTLYILHRIESIMGSLTGTALVLSIARSFKCVRSSELIAHFDGRRSSFLTVVGIGIGTSIWSRAVLLYVEPLGEGGIIWYGLPCCER
jgi:hypothetical protein